MAKQVKTRIQHKYDFKENWEKASSFIPLKGELITVAPDTTNVQSGCEFNIPYRIKIGDGKHSLQELPYVGMPVVKYPDSEDAVLLGFNSITLLQTYDSNLILNLSAESINNIKNYEQQEFIHHRIFVPANPDLEVRCSNITLTILGDGSGISANDVDISFIPSKCMLSSWHTGNTVSSSSYSISKYEVTIESNSSKGQISYPLYLPKDKNKDEYIFTQGSFMIDVTGFLFKTSENTMSAKITVENSFIAHCSKSVETSTTN